MRDLIDEPIGFKFTIGGFGTWFASILQGADLTQLLGFAALVIGLIIQIVSYVRNTNADKRSKEADDRAKVKYDLEMKVLARQLVEIEQGITNGSGK